MSLREHLCIFNCQSWEGDRNRKEANEQTKRINIIGVNKKRRGGFSLIQICAALIDRPTDSVVRWLGSSVLEFLFVWTICEHLWEFGIWRKLRDFCVNLINVLDGIYRKTKFQIPKESSNTSSGVITKGVSSPSAIKSYRCSLPEFVLKTWFSVTWYVTV